MTNGARNDYVTCRGDHVWDNMLYNGFTQMTRGMFGSLNQYFSTAWVTDGTSNTIAVSETVSSPYMGWLGIHGGVVVSPIAHLDWNPAGCMAVRSPTVPDMMVGTWQWSFRGNWFADGRPCNEGFTTVLPPNSPSCHGQEGPWDETGWGIYSANSFHPGGVNGLMTDGSVHFVSETIDCGNLSAPAPYAGGSSGSGPSPYGVWGAMGSAWGAEPLQAP
jgi:prepilin-type processing-associated H-X9-DG protein